MRPMYHTRISPIAGEKPPSPLGRHVVVDVETTGLSPRHGHRVIEIGAVAVEEGAVVGEFTTLIDAGVPIPPAVQAIHGITDEMLEGQPTTGGSPPALFRLHRGQRSGGPQRRLRGPLPPPRVRQAEDGPPQPACLHAGDEPPPLPPPAGPHPGDGLPAPVPRRRPSSGRTTAPWTTRG